MTDKQIMTTMESYHCKVMREPTKRLRAAIEQASKKRCWYNGWKHEGDLADYGTLHDPMREFLLEANFEDICTMCDYLLKKANAQIEKSDDDGDCAAQARYWMEKLLKALMKSEAELADKMAWLEDFQKRDEYFLADSATIMLEKEKKNAMSREDWSRLADMKIAKFRNAPRAEDDDTSDEDIFRWVDDNETVKEIESALRNAGRQDEITQFRMSILERFGNAGWVAESLLADGKAQEAESWFEKHLEQDKVSTETKARLREFTLVRGDWVKAAAFDAEAFFDNPSVDRYDQLIAICGVVGLAEPVRKAVFRALESGIRPDFDETKTANWPLPIVSAHRIIVEEPKPNFRLLSELAWREHHPADALSYYKRLVEQRQGDYGGSVWDFDWLMAERIAPIWPYEAIAIWERIIANSTDAHQGDYDNIVRALECMKPILFVSGEAKEFRGKVRNMIERNKRRRNLVEALEKIL